MTEYRPKSRRPIADAFRRTATLAVNLCVRARIHPDAISYASIVASAIAATLFFFTDHHPLFSLILAPLFCYVRLWLNMLDGMVALAADKASLRGEILNDLPDRISDILIFAGVAHGGWCLLPLGYWAAMMALLVAYVGLFGQALGGRREFGGIMSKPWRMVALHLGAWSALIVWRTSGTMYIVHNALTPIDIALFVILLGSVQTIAVRLRAIFRTLPSQRAKPNSK